MDFTPYTVLQIVTESPICLAAESTGIFIWLNDSDVTSMKNNLCMAVLVAHKITTGNYYIDDISETCNG